MTWKLSSCARCGLDVLAEVVDLHDVDQAGVEIGFEQARACAPGSRAGTGRCGRFAGCCNTPTKPPTPPAPPPAKPDAARSVHAAAAGGSAADAEHADTALAAGALAGKAGQAGAAQQTADARHGLHRPAIELPTVIVRVEALAIALESPQVVQQVALGARQASPSTNHAAAAAQQRLNEVEVDQRRGVVRVLAGELPHERIGKAHQQLRRRWRMSC